MSVFRIRNEKENKTLQTDEIRSALLGNYLLSYSIVLPRMVVVVAK